MKKILLATVILTTVILSNCADKPKSGSDRGFTIRSKEYREGFSIVDQNCVSCHSPHAGIEDRIAPPLAEVKKHYLSNEMTEDEFIDEIVSFLSKPTIENAKMHKAIEKFGIMADLGYTEEQYQAVATYLYQADLEDPEWYEEHYTKEKEGLMKNSDRKGEDYVKKGLNLALASKSVLGKNLLIAIKERGSAGAVAFCTDRAIQITDSMSTVLNAKIRRVSDKNRNIKNRADQNEFDYIQEAKSQIRSDGKASPKVLERDGSMIGYYPIITNGMCMQCHGNPSVDIEEETFKTIKKNYPEDLATGYGINELRGIWVIEMERSK